MILKYRKSVPGSSICVSGLRVIHRGRVTLLVAPSSGLIDGG